MAIGLNPSAKKKSGAGATATAKLLVAVLLPVLLACLSGASAAKEEVAAAIPDKSWGPTLRASKGVGIDEYGRVRGERCDIFPSVCHILHVPGMACCGVSCVDVKSHTWHCGKCNYVCPPGRVCCNGKCKSVSRDSNHCGACNRRCPAPLRCEYGLCGY